MPKLVTKSATSASARVRVLALLAAGAVGVWASPAFADCSSQGAQVVVPGTSQRVAPKNTHVFVTSTDTKLLDAELRQLADGQLVPAQVSNRVDAENGSRTIELTPNALLEAGSGYDVRGVYAHGSAMLATFRVLDELDREPPRFGEVELFLTRDSGRVVFDALLDDTTRDEDLRLLFWRGEQDPHRAGAPLPFIVLLPGRFADGRATYFLEGALDECNSRGHAFPEAAEGAAYTLALSDQAGQLSAARVVKVPRRQLLGEVRVPAKLYYVPVLDRLLQARSLALVIGSALLGLLALAGAVGWRARRRRLA